MKAVENQLRIVRANNFFIIFYSIVYFRINRMLNARVLGERVELLIRLVLIVTSLRAPLADE